jgi:hypothetical protein
MFIALSRPDETRILISPSGSFIIKIEPSSWCINTRLSHERMGLNFYWITENSIRVKPGEVAAVIARIANRSLALLSLLRMKSSRVPIPASSATFSFTFHLHSCPPPAWLTRADEKKNSFYSAVYTSSEVFCMFVCVSQDT